MSIEELLITRIKVIADYPNSNYDVGEILTCPYEESVYENWAKLLDKFPAIFRRMNWAEDRKPEELPEYVKLTRGQTTIVGSLIVKHEEIYVVWCDGTWTNVENLALFEPATQSDYEAYQKQK